jgi:hypothetical protein
MAGSRPGRRALIARGVLLLAAVLLLPLAAMLQPPREAMAQSAGQDSLWAGGQTGIGVCADPSSSASLSGCFAPAASSWSVQYNQAVATDGLNVYFVSQTTGGLSCPIADLGTNCTPIMAGPWGSDRNALVASLAAANGQIWIGQSTGELYRCPANLPYAEQDTMPSQCVLLDDAGNRPVQSLLLANGRLYAGLACAGDCVEQKKQGLLWSCSPDTMNDCSTLDSYGETTAYSLAAGGGYLWAGLKNGIIWKCDLNAANACSTWDQAGNLVYSISYDGESTLYAAINDKHGVIWSCRVSTANACSNLVTDVNGAWSVAAGAETVFSSTVKGELRAGTNSFSGSGQGWAQSILLYVPADGPAGVGGVSVKMSARNLSQKLEKTCSPSGAGKMPKAIVTLTGPNDFAKTMKVGACTLVKTGATRHRVDLLDPGAYTVTVQAGKHRGKASFTIEQDLTRPVNVKLKRSSTGD